MRADPIKCLRSSGNPTAGNLKFRNPNNSTAGGSKNTSLNSTTRLLTPEVRKKASGRRGWSLNTSPPDPVVPTETVPLTVFCWALNGFPPAVSSVSVVTAGLTDYFRPVGLSLSNHHLISPDYTQGSLFLIEILGPAKALILIILSCKAELEHIIS
jgi:hypothetical protein